MDMSLTKRATNILLTSEVCNMDQEHSMQNDTDLRQELETVKRDLAVQTATQAGAQATQAATQAGAQATQAAAVSGLAMAVGSGFITFIIGIFVGLTINKVK
jgi:hypothetical protein